MPEAGIFDTFNYLNRGYNQNALPLGNIIGSFSRGNREAAARAMELEALRQQAMEAMYNQQLQAAQGGYNPYVTNVEQQRSQIGLTDAQAAGLRQSQGFNDRFVQNQGMTPQEAEYVEGTRRFNEQASQFDRQLGESQRQFDAGMTQAASQQALGMAEGDRNRQLQAQIAQQRAAVDALPFTQPFMNGGDTSLQGQVMGLAFPSMQDYYNEQLAQQDAARQAEVDALVGAQGGAAANWLRSQSPDDLLTQPTSLNPYPQPAAAPQPQTQVPQTPQQVPVFSMQNAQNQQLGSSPLGQGFTGMMSNIGDWMTTPPQGGQGAGGVGFGGGGAPDNASGAVEGAMQGAAAGPYGMIAGALMNQKGGLQYSQQASGNVGQDPGQMGQMMEDFMNTPTVSPEGRAQLQQLLQLLQTTQPQRR